MPRIDINNSTPVENTSATIRQNNLPSSDKMFSGFSSAVHGYNRNYVLEKIRRVYTESRDIQSIIRHVQVNALGTFIRPNFVFLKRKFNLSQEQMEFLEETWKSDISDAVANVNMHLYGLQDAIIEELCISGEIYIYVWQKAGKIILHPIYSEFIDPTLSKDDYIDETDNKRKKYIIYGIEYDAESHRPIAYWMRNPYKTNDNSSAYRLPIENTIRIAYQNSFYRRGTPFLSNPAFIQKLWSISYNLANKTQRHLSVVGFLNTFKPQNILSSKSGASPTMLGNARASLDNNPTGKTIDPTISYEKASIAGTTLFGYGFNEVDNFGVLHNAETMNFTPTDSIGGSTLDAIDRMDGKAAAGMGATKEQLTADYGDVTYSAGRYSLKISQLFTDKHFTQKIVAFMETFWEMWVRSHGADKIIGQFIRNGVALKPSWIMPQPVDIDPVKTANANLLKMQAGTLTTQEILIAEGKDPEMHRAMWLEDDAIYHYKGKDKPPEEKEDTDETTKPIE